MSTSDTTPVRLFWVKDNDTPVNVIPADSTHEIYSILRSKALQQRQTASSGFCPYDMDVLYQFWSHFLIRNFNTRMYDEFRNFAFEDAANLSDVGLSNLIKFYGEALLSQSVIRDHVARDYIELVRSESEPRRPGLKQLQSVMRHESLEPWNRQRLVNLLDADLLASLE
ncbi:hypothetical protein CC80DRAFT_413861 [Byssothecium circinans]|uniref:Uncharacterized protein n=1 Tax=Byssothecium circinans TaxID=147558 RepID=A0A6A5TZY8_9PLEO|nr:hypothetical protein CC80DRAFT_413861 [Byssothecium circinans]